MIKKANKPVLRQLWDMSVGDTRTVTGRNMRNILLLTNKGRVEDITREDVTNIVYHPLGVEDEWIRDILAMRAGDMVLPSGGCTMEDMEEILIEACTS